MYIKDILYRVDFSAFCERHYCKDFKKKYSLNKWLDTKETIIAVLERAHVLQNSSLVDTLKFSQEDGIGIFKMDFRVAGTKFSPKTSGNRVIFALNHATGNIVVLLVYGKDHCAKRQSETQWILEQIKENFTEYKRYC